MPHLRVELAEHFQIDLGDDRPTGDFKRLHDVRVQLGHRRDAPVARHQLGRATRMMVRLRSRNDLRLNAELREHIDHNVAD